MMRKMRRFLAFALAVMMFMSNTVTASATSTGSGDIVVDETIVEGSTVVDTGASSGEEKSSSAVVEEQLSEPSGEGSDVTPSEPSGEGDDVTDPSNGNGGDEFTSSETTTETATEETTVEETTEEETAEELPEAPLLKDVSTNRNNGETVGIYIDEQTSYYFLTIADAIGYLNENAMSGQEYLLSVYEACEVSGDDLVSTSGAKITIYFSNTITVTADENNNTTARINVNMQGTAGQAAATLSVSDGVSLQLLQGSEEYTFTNMTIKFAENNDDALIIGSESDIKSWYGPIVVFYDVTLTNVENMTIYNGFRYPNCSYSENGVSIGNLTVEMIELGEYGAGVEFESLYPYLLTIDNLNLDGCMMVDDLIVNESITATDDSSIQVHGEASLNNLSTTPVDKEGWLFSVNLVDKYDISYDEYKQYAANQKPQPVSYASLNLSGTLNPAKKLNIIKQGNFPYGNGVSEYREIAFNLNDIYSAGVATVTLSKAEGAEIANASLMNPNNYDIWAWKNGKIWQDSNRISPWNFDYVQVEYAENTYQLLVQEAPSEIQLYVDQDGDASDNNGYYFASLEDVKEYITEVNPSAAAYYIWINADDLEVSGDVLNYSSFTGTFQNAEGQVVGAKVNLNLNGNTLKVMDDATIAVDSVDGGCYNENGEIAGSFSDISLAEKGGITLTLAPRTVDKWGNYSISSYAIRILSNASNIKIGREADWTTSEAHMGITFVNEVMSMDLYGRVNIESTSQTNVINNLYVHNVSENNNWQEAYITNMTVKHLYATEGNVGFDKVNVANTLYLKSGQNFSVKAGGSAEIKNVEVWENAQNPGACASFELERTMKLASDDDLGNPTFTGATEKIKTSTIKITGTVDRQGNAQPIMVRKLKGWEYTTTNEEGYDEPHYNSRTEEFVNGETVITATNTTTPVSPDAFMIEGSYRFLQRSGTALKAAGAVLRVIYEGENGKEVQYTSLEEAVKNMPADFGSANGRYVFQILNDTKLKADVTVPAFVEELIFETESYGYHDEELDDWVSCENTRHQKFLDLNGKKISTSAGIRMNGGVRIYSSIATAGKLVSTNEECALEIREEHTFVDADGNEVDRALVLDNVLVTAKEGGVNIWCMDEYGNEDDDRDNIMRASFETRDFFIEGGRWIIEDNAKTKNYIKAADFRVNGCNSEEENAEVYVEEAYLSVSQLILTNGYGNIYGGLDAGTATLSGAGLDIYGWSNMPTLSATNSDVWVNGSLCSENVTLNKSNLYEFWHVEVATKLTMSNGAQVEVWNDFHAKEITAAASKILIAPEGSGSLHADKISVTTAFAGDVVGDYTLQNNGQLLVREKLSMTAGTLENGGLIEAGEVSVKDLNNSQFNDQRGQILCNKFTNTGKMYLSEDSHILINESGTLNNVNVGDRYGNYGFALVGRSEDATVTFKGTFTRNDEDQQLLGFVTNEYVGKIGDSFVNGDGNTEYNWDWITLTDDNDTEDNDEDDFDADYVEVLASDEILFKTEISAFPVEAVRVLPWKVAGDQGRVDNSNNAVYQSGKDLKVIGEYIHVSSRSTSGETWLKSFTNWKDAVAYINALNNASVTYIIDTNADIDVKGKLDLPTKAAEVVIRSGRGDIKRDGEGNPVLDEHGYEIWIAEPIVLSYQGDITLNTITAFENIRLEPYAISNGKIVPYKSSIDTRGKLLNLFNVEVWARKYNEDGITFTYDDSSLKAVKGTATTQVNLHNGTHLVVDTKISGLNEIDLTNGSSLIVTGGLSVNNLVTLCWEEGRDNLIVSVNGENSILEVKTRLNMYAPSEINCQGSMKIKDLYSECAGNILRTAKENKITISGRVLSESTEAWNKEPVVAVRDDAENIVGYRYPTEEERNSWETAVTDADKAEMMPFAVRVIALDGGSKLVTAAQVSPIWFLADSGDDRCAFDFTHKEGDLIVSGTNKNDAVVLYVLFDEETQEMNRFASLQDAFNEIEKISSPDMSYVITLNADDMAYNEKTKKVIDYTFPKKAKEVIIVSAGGTKTITYNKDLKLGSNVTMENVILDANTSGTLTLDKFMLHLTDVKFDSLDAEDKAVTYSVSGSGVAKGSELVLINCMCVEEDGVVFAKVANVNFLGLDNTDVLVAGESSVGNLYVENGEEFTGLGKISVANICSSETPATIITAPKLTKDRSGNITKTEATMTVTEEILGNVTFELSDGTVDGRLSLGGADLTKLAGESGIPFVKAAKASVQSVSINGRTDYIYKKAGIFVYKSVAPQVELSYSSVSGPVVDKFETFADAVAEINGLKDKRDYTIRFMADTNEAPATMSSAEVPVALTMPSANCIDTLILTADSGAPVYFKNDITFNSNVVLNNIDFIQVVTEKGVNYTLDNAQGEFEKYYNPLKVKVNGAYTLDVEGDVTFNNAIALDGSGKATLLLDDTNALFVAQPTSSVINQPDAYVEGSIKNFASVRVDSGSLTVNGYTSGTFVKSTFKGAELNVTNLDIINDGIVEVGSEEYIAASTTVKNLTMAGGDLKSYGNGTFTNVTLNGFTPDGILEEDIPNIEVYGQTFKITGTLTTTSGADLQTELDAKKLISVLNISGNVVLENPATDQITVHVNAPEGHPDFYLGGTYEYVDKKGNEVEAVYSNKLLTAPKADISAFKAAEECVNGEEEYTMNGYDGYILKKSGNDILVYYSDEVEAALFVKHGEEYGLYNYYTSFNEAVAAIEARKDTTAEYAIQLLNTVGNPLAYEKVNMPTKAAHVRIEARNNRPNYIYNNNDLTLGCDTTFDGVILFPQIVSGKPKGISVNGWTLTINSGATDRIGKITGKNKADKVVLNLDNNLTIFGDITNVTDLVLKNTKADGVSKLLVTGKVTVTNLTYENTCDFTAFSTGSTIKNLYSASNDASVNKLYYEDINITGDISVENPGSTFDFYQVTEKIPAGYDAKGVKLTLNAPAKLATVKQADLTNVAFYNADLTPIADAQWSAGAVYAVDNPCNAVTVYKVDGTTKLADCVDLTQATAYITAKADKNAEYVIGIATDIEDTSVTDTSAPSKMTMPAKDKMASLIVKGADYPYPVIKFTGDIATNGVVTLQELQLKNNADFSITNKKNSDVKKEGIDGEGKLALEDVTIVTTQTVVKDKPVVKGYLKNITGEKNVTKLSINFMSEVLLDENDTPTSMDMVNLSGGITNIVEMTLSNTALVTNAKSEVAELKLASSGSWVGFNATTIGSVDNSEQDSYSYLGTYLAKGVPQLTINGTVKTPVKMKLYDFASKKEIWDKYLEENPYKSQEELYQNQPLVIAKTEAAEKFIAEPFAAWPTESACWKFKTGNAYKDVKNYVYNGDVSVMEVLLQASVDGVASSETYVATYAEAINIINNIGNKNADYTIVLRATGANTNDEEVSVIKTALSNGVAAYGSLALPAANKAKSLTITKTDGSANPFVIQYTGTMSPKCDLNFENIILTEGTTKTVDGKVVFTPSNYITPDYSGVVVTFGENVSTLNAVAPANFELNETPDLVFNKVSVAKNGKENGVLDVTGHNVYVNGEIKVTDIRLNGDASLATKGKITLENIIGEGTLTVNTSYTDAVWGKATTQFTINGEMHSDVNLVLAQYICETKPDKSKKYHLLDMSYEEDLFYYGDGKPAARQKLITAPKLQLSETAENKQFTFAAFENGGENEYYAIKYEGAVYLTNNIPAIEVSGSEGEDTLYRANFFTWDQAVKEIDKLNHAPSKTEAGWNYTIILREDIGIEEPIKNLTFPSKAAMVFVSGDDDEDVEGIIMTGTTVSLKTDLEIKVPIVAMKKTGNNYYDTVYTVNTGNYDLVMNNVPMKAEFDEMGEHWPSMKLSGSAKGTATIIPEYLPEEDGTTYNNMITQISNVGMVTLGNTIFYDEYLGDVAKGRSCFAIPDGISGVGELVLEPGAMAVSDKKDISVKNLTMGDSVEPFPVVDGDEKPFPVVDGMGYPPNELSSGISAKNITVSNTLSMASSYMKAGLTTGNDGKVTLNNVILRDNHNTIEGKQDKNGKSQINIKGTVTAEGEHIERFGTAITIGLYYNNSAWKYVPLSEDMILLTAPKAAASWFNPNYGWHDDNGTPEDYTDDSSETLMGYYSEDFNVYKSGNNVQYGRVDTMEVRLMIEDDGTSMLFKTFEEAVKAIDGMGLQKEVVAENGKVTKVYKNYRIDLLNDVEIGNEKLNGQFKALSLPSKAGEVVLVGNGYEMRFSGNVALRCNTVFDGMKLLPMKTIKGEARPTTANFTIGNFFMVWANSACDEDSGEFVDLKDCTTCIGNITGGAKGELHIVGDSRLKANNITGLNSICFDNPGNMVPENDAACGQILTDGNVTIKELHYHDKSGGILRVRGTFTTNVINVDGECNAQIWNYDNKPIKINGITLTEKDETGKTVKINESVIYANDEYQDDHTQRVVVKTVATNASTVAPSTKIITGKYLDENEWCLWSWDTSNVSTYECNSYMSGNDIYMGAKQ